MIDDLYEWIRPRLPPAGTPVDDLTDEQRIAVAISAGVVFSTSLTKNTLTITTNPCAIAMDGDGRYMVFVLRDESQSETPVSKRD